MNSKHAVKNITFAFGLAFLLLGALTFHIQDWDVGVSLVMGLCCFPLFCQKIPNRLRRYC